MKTEIEKKDNFKFYHILIPFVTIPVFSLCALSYGWISYATVTNRSGLWGGMYAYYDLTKLQYSIYEITATLIFTGLIIFQIKYLVEKDCVKLNKLFRIMGLLVVLILLSEFYLQTKFVGKG